MAYFWPAAIQGMALPLFFLGMICAGGGPSVKADPIQAYKWLLIAGHLHKSSQYRNDALASRALVAQSMTKSQTVIAERLAFDWKEKSQQRCAAEQ